MDQLIDPADLTIEVWPPDQKGGQHVGRSPNGIKLTHEPSGLVAIAINGGSQHRNRAVALAMIEGGLTCPQFQL